MSTINILLLNIGSNPLPNYVVAKYLLEKERDDKEKLPIPNYLILLHSSITEPYAKNIKDMLDFPNENIELHSLGDKERKSKFIHNLIQEILNKINNKQQIKSIHLNYTGGTKPMAVHSFQAVHTFAQENGIKAIFSDLNNKEFRIVLDNEESSYPKEKDLRDYIKLSIKDIFSLHNMELISSEDKTNYDNFDGIANFVKDFFDETSSKNFNQSERWLKGKWLEEYVYLTILHMKEQLNITEVQMSVEAMYEDRDCEIDIAVLKGYQLYVISCTTSKKIQAIKTKAFEAMYRAEQLGGDHAKVIVVTIKENELKNPQQNRDAILLDDIENDLSSFDARENKKVELIGLETIQQPDLLKKKLASLLSD